jgi:hypothetical protein
LIFTGRDLDDLFERMTPISSQKIFAAIEHFLMTVEDPDASGCEGGLIAVLITPNGVRSKAWRELGR